MNNTLSGAELVNRWRNGDRLVPQVRYLLLESSQKQISLTQLPRSHGAALVAPAHTLGLAAELT